MIILPAIDIKDGCCVRLRRGDFATAHKVAEDAVQTAAAFSTAGAAWIHMVDLDGAKAVSYTHLRAHETGRNLVCRLLLEKKKIKRLSE